MCIILDRISLLVNASELVMPVLPAGDSSVKPSCCYIVGPKIVDIFLKVKGDPWKRKLEESACMGTGPGLAFLKSMDSLYRGKRDFKHNWSRGVNLKCRITSSLPKSETMPIMPGRYPPKTSQQSEVIFEHNSVEVPSQIQNQANCQDG